MNYLNFDFDAICRLFEIGNQDEIDCCINCLNKNDHISKKNKKELFSMYESYMAQYFQFSFIGNKRTVIESFIRLKRRDISNKSIKLNFYPEQNNGIITFYYEGKKVKTIQIQNNSIHENLDWLRVDSLIVTNGNSEEHVKIEKVQINNVLFGKDNWLFLINDRNDSVNQFLGNIHLTQKEKENWNKFSSEMSKIASKHELIFVIAPSKERVFPKFYPYSPGNPRLTCEVSKILSSKKIAFLDPVSSLAADTKTFSQTDTHWTYRGAYAVLKNILRHWNLTLPEMSFTEGNSMGDLGNKLIPIQYSTISYPKLDTLSEIEEIFCNYLTQDGFSKYSINRQAPINKKIILFGDSYSRYWYPFLEHAFRESIFFRTSGGLIFDVIDIEKPDYILIERAERFLVNAPSNSKTIDDCDALFRKIRLNKEQMNRISDIIRDNAGTWYSDYLSKFVDVNS